MRRAAAAMGMLFAIAGRAQGKPPPPRPLPHAASPPPIRAWVAPAPPLPMLPSIARVRIEAATDRVLLLQEVNLPRGEWQSGGLSFYVAFGAPGTPLAVDARLVPVPAGALESRLEDAGEAVPVEPAVRRDASAQLLLGRPQMSGVFIRASEGMLRRAYAPNDLVALRIRSVVLPPATNAEGARDLVVRLGIAGGLALTLGRIQLLSQDEHTRIARAEARLCGPESDSFPLAIAVIPKAEQTVPTIAPAMAVRHGSDDLCIRWWIKAQ